MSIQGYAEGITSGVFENERAPSAAEIILSESERLSDMVEDLLYLSRLDANPVKEEYVEFDCLSLLDNAIESASVTSPEKQIAFDKPPAPFPLLGNPKEFERAFLNILSNAFRHACREVHILCDPDSRTISISDDGPGIAPEDFPHIFARFYKGQGGCTGLGLAISKSAFEKMGGTLTAENLASGGARFTINLP